MLDELHHMSVANNFSMSQSHYRISLPFFVYIIVIVDIREDIRLLPNLGWITLLWYSPTVLDISGSIAELH